MGANAIRIYERCSKTVICTVTGLANLDGYTATLTARANKDDTTAVIEETGSIVGLVITFTLLPADTNETAKIYYYDIVIVSATNNYTIVQDELEIKRSVKY